MDVVYDIETMPNFFSCSAYNGGLRWYFEISDWQADNQELLEWLEWLHKINARMVSFNGVMFDYVVLHRFIKMKGKMTAMDLYRFAQTVITASEDDRFANTIWSNDRYVTQLDLFQIWHFSNKARMTSLKALEFNMRMDIKEMPIAFDVHVNREQSLLMQSYNEHDVNATYKFYQLSTEKIKLREELSVAYSRDFLNFSDVKIGTTIFEIELEKAGVELYTYSSNGRQPRQTKRPVVALNDCIPKWIQFDHHEFKRVLDWLRQQVVSETKGVFKDLVARVDGLDFVFGTGGLHASVEDTIVIARPDRLIKSKDVSSYYPNLAIHHKFYPEHLTERFCHIYKMLYEKRKTYPKGSAFNAAYKLALNGTFGVSNSPFSVFYDPRFMLSITLSGQLMLAMLIDKLIQVPTVEMVMTNTDGLEYTIHPDYVAQLAISLDQLQDVVGMLSPLLCGDLGNLLHELDEVGVVRCQDEVGGILGNRAGSTGARFDQRRER